MNEYLIHDKSACHVKEYENSHALADTIIRVCDDNSYHETLSTGAIKATQQFERSAIDAMEVAIYQEAQKLPPLPQDRRIERKLWRGWEALVTSCMETLGIRSARGVWHWISHLRYKLDYLQYET